MIKCQICNKELKDFQRLSSHLKIHKISSIKYYEKYVTIGKCKICGNKNVRFLGLNKGFRKLCKNCCRGLTIQKCIIRHGNKKGLKIWNEYLKKQSYSNSLEYKNMTQETFDEYNKSRAVTLKNMIKKYGENAGNEKWKSYCEKQKTNGNSQQYFIKKYGEVAGNEKWKVVNGSKANSLSNFQKRYGEEDGIIKFEKYMDSKKIKNFSKISQELFWKIYKKVKNNKIYFYELNKEFGKLNVKNEEYYYYDFVDLTNKKVIEFNGNCFHVKNIKESDDWKNPFSDISAEVVFQKDLRKQNFIKKLGFKVLYVWEDDYKKDKNKEIKKCLTFLEK